MAYERALHAAFVLIPNFYVFQIIHVCKWPISSAKMTLLAHFRVLDLFRAPKHHRAMLYIFFFYDYQI